MLAWVLALTVTVTGSLGFLTYQRTSRALDEATHQVDELRQQLVDDQQNLRDAQQSLEDLG